MSSRRAAAGLLTATIVLAACTAGNRSGSATTAIAVGQGTRSVGAATATSAGPSAGASGAAWEQITPPISLTATDFGNQNYGTQTIALSPADPSIVYLGTCYQGIWRTGDHGVSWTKVNVGENGANLDTGRNWTLAVDPNDPNVVYTVAGYGYGQGLWKSTNGGRDWRQMLSDAVRGRTTGDIYSVAIDPDDHQHLLLGSHSPWGDGQGASGVLESRDGGISWIVHPPQPSWGSGHYVLFIASDRWLVATQSNGMWLTADAGDTWAKVSDANMQHGATQLYRAVDGTLYVGAATTLLRSTDEGQSWSPVGPRSQDGYHAIIGDGRRLYALAANTGGNTVDPDPSFSISAETDGQSWQPYNGGRQTFTDGPMSMAYDARNKVLYSSSWGAGVWRLDVHDSN